LCFFFSRRRRHTRSKRDWSSDVCSSDLRIKNSRYGYRERNDGLYESKYINAGKSTNFSHAYAASPIRPTIIKTRIERVRTYNVFTYGKNSDEKKNCLAHQQSLVD